MFNGAQSFYTLLAIIANHSLSMKKLTTKFFEWTLYVIVEIITVPNVFFIVDFQVPSKSPV